MILELAATTIKGALDTIRNAAVSGRPRPGNHVTCYAAVGMAIHARKRPDDSVLIFGTEHGPTHGILVNNRNLTVRDTGDGDYDGDKTYWHKTKAGHERNKDDSVTLLHREQVKDLGVLSVARMQVVSAIQMKHWFKAVVTDTTHLKGSEVGRNVRVMALPGGRYMVYGMNIHTGPIWMLTSEQAKQSLRAIRSAAPHYEVRYLYGADATHMAADWAWFKKTDVWKKFSAQHGVDV